MHLKGNMGTLFCCWTDANLLLFFVAVKSIVGAGVLSLPYGVAVFGNNPSALVPAVGLIALMGILSGYTFGLIGRVCQNSNTMSYSDAWDATVGTKFSPLIAFSCFIDCFAGNLSYSMILADTLMNLLASTGTIVTRTQSLMGVTSVVLMPLCLMKNLSSLAPFSLVGIGGMLYTTLAMGLRWSSKSYAASGKFYASQLAPPLFGTNGASSALSFSALILTCMLSNAYIARECPIGSSHPFGRGRPPPLFGSPLFCVSLLTDFNAPKFLSELKDNTMSRFHQVIGWSFASSIVIYGLITAFGFLTFGAASNGKSGTARKRLEASRSCACPFSIFSFLDDRSDLEQLQHGR